MAGYQRVYADVWDQPWSEDARYAAFYLMTCEHRITEGLYRLPIPYAWADLRWTPERFEAAFGELIADGFVEYDRQAQVVLLTGALELQQPGNANQITGAVRALDRLPDTPLFQRFHGLAKAFAEPFAKALAKAFPERLTKGLPEGLPQGFGNSPSPPPSQRTPESSTAQSAHTPDSGVEIWRVA